MPVEFRENFDLSFTSLLGDFDAAKKPVKTEKPKPKGGSKPVRGGGHGDVQVHKKHIPKSGK